MELVLASGSPRRIELLGKFFPGLVVCPAGVDESLPDGIAPGNAVRMLARRKCDFVAEKNPGRFVVGADTVVAIDGAILGKPRDRADAARMLRLLSGRCHNVFTGVALAAPDGRRRVFCRRTGVTFYPLDDGAIEWYLDSGESFDKAGAYGIQEKGALLVRRIDGDYFNVMGLPVAETVRAIRDLGGGAPPEIG